MNSFIAEHWPRISDHPESTLAFCFFENSRGFQQALIVYEARRDFLSAPRPFVGLLVQLGSEPLFCVGGNFLDDALWAGLKALDYSVYSVSGSGYCTSPDEVHYLCYSPKVILEFCAEKMLLLDVRYHHNSVTSALAAFLSEREELSCAPSSPSEEERD